MLESRFREPQPTREPQSTRQTLKYFSLKRMNNKSFSCKITIFHGRRAPEEVLLVGYGHCKSI